MGLKKDNKQISDLWHGIVDNEKKEWIEYMRKKVNTQWDIAICILLLFILGLFPDICYYYLRDEWDCIGEISRGMAGFFLPMGITYETASGKIMNLAGVIITVVGLIISTYMNLMQRLEKFETNK